MTQRKKKTPLHESLDACFATPGVQFQISRTLFGSRSPQRIRDMVYNRAITRVSKVNVSIDDTFVRVCVVPLDFALRRNAIRKSLRKAYFRLNRSVGSVEQVRRIFDDVAQLVVSLEESQNVRTDSAGTEGA